MKLEEITQITKNFKVLFVEDDASVREVTSRILNLFFPVVDTASNGIEGLEKFENNFYNLVISDLAMPKMDGLEMLKKMKAKKPDLYILILSAMKNPDAVVESIKVGIDGYLFKPIQFDKVIESLENIIRKEMINNKLVVYKSNIDEEVEKRVQKIEEEVNLDKVTGLKTLASLVQKLEHMDNFHSPVVVLINIDHFKTYNQLYGLDIGNEILFKFSKLLVNYNENRDYELFRINADEFVLLHRVEYLDIDKYEKDMKELFETKFTVIVESLDVSIDLEITAGISFSSSQALKKANMALYEARKRGRNFIGFSYDIDYTNELESNLFWRQEIKNAIDENRVVAFYQPIVNREQEIVQYESLIRIKRINKDTKDYEYLAPNKFLDLSVLTKQYLQLTRFMIESSLDNMKEKGVSIAINLTYQDIKNDDIAGILKENIRKFHVESLTEFDISNNVIFEIIEHEGIDCYQTFMDFITEFKQMGVKIALDDFGTGFSNFSHINKLAPDFIKIDGSLIENIDKSEKSLELVKALVKFSKELDIKTIAENVHSKEIFDICYDLGIDKFQGYYFGEPREDI